ncbi:hypothetical protein EVAR_73992_1 [Eumeta japonica]|uniref:Uncharacterized protein n=1 Tax=Eumeta variegata TaxID=151549 RepID=A0A4C1TID0_EUMVA|nr:hypothetical protein EVAR_73992_1 [Eumeta japonica]
MKHIIFEWGRIHRAEFNACKTRCFLVTHNPASSGIASIIIKDEKDFEELKALNVIGPQSLYRGCWAKKLISDNMATNSIDSLEHLLQCGMR